MRHQIRMPNPTIASFARMVLLLASLITLSSFAEQRDAPPEAWKDQATLDAWIAQQGEMDNANYYRTQAMVFFAAAKVSWERKYIKQAERMAKLFYKSMTRWYVLNDNYYRCLGKIP
jgi:hypothetical protein